MPNSDNSTRAIIQVSLKRSKAIDVGNNLPFSATHLLNAAIRSLFKKVTYQVSSSVTSDHCKLELGLLGKRIQKGDVQLIEDLIK